MRTRLVMLCFVALLAMSASSGFAQLCSGVGGPAGGSFCLTGRYFTSNFIRWYSSDAHDGRAAEHDIWLTAFNTWMSNLNDNAFDGTGIDDRNNYDIRTATADYGNTSWVGLCSSETNGPVIKSAFLRINSRQTNGYSRGQQVSVGMHEFGHAFGLDHVTDLYDLMLDNASTDCGSNPNSNVRPITCPGQGAVTGVHVLRLALAQNGGTLGSVGGKERSVILLRKAESYGDTAELTRGADLVVRGAVLKRLPSRELYGHVKRTDPKSGATELFRDLEDALPVTDTLIRVEEVIKGDPKLAGRTIKVQQEGGIQDGREIWAEGVPRMRQKDRVILFLRPYVDGEGKATDSFLVLGLDEGLFRVKNNRAFAARSEDSSASDGGFTPEQKKALAAILPAPSPHLTLEAPAAEGLETGTLVEEFLATVRKAMKDSPRK